MNFTRTFQTVGGMAACSLDAGRSTGTAPSGISIRSSPCSPRFKPSASLNLKLRRSFTSSSHTFLIGRAYSNLRSSSSEFDPFGYRTIELLSECVSCPQGRGPDVKLKFKHMAPGRPVSNRYFGHLKLLRTKIYAASSWVLFNFYQG